MKQILRGLAIVLIFIVALGTTARVLNDVQLFAEIPTLRDKWNHYREHKDEYNSILIGTSRTYRGVMPTILDQLTAQNGVPTKTYNFGIDGMFPPEDAFVADKILRDPPKNLRWVFLELGLFVDDFEGRNPEFVRTIYWHDLKRTLLCTRARLWPRKKSEKWKNWFRSEKGKASPASDCLTHWRVFFVKTLNLGRGSELLNDQLMGRRGKGLGNGPANDGFDPMPPERVMNAKALAEYQADIKKLTEKQAKIRPLPIYGEESLEGVIKRIRELGAEPVVFIAPTTGSRREYPSESLALPMIDLRVPQEMPELFEPEMRADPAHMSAKGAEAMTRRFAEKFVPIAKSKGSSQTSTPSSSR
jgi:hypothetical protein